MLSFLCNAETAVAYNNLHSTPLRKSTKYKVAVVQLNKPRYNRIQLVFYQKPI